LINQQEKEGMQDFFIQNERKRVLNWGREEIRQQIPASVSDLVNISQGLNRFSRKDTQKRHDLWNLCNKLTILNSSFSPEKKQDVAVMCHGDGCNGACCWKRKLSNWSLHYPVMEVLETREGRKIREKNCQFQLTAWQTNNDALNKQTGMKTFTLMHSKYF
jgi:hypothetical protein